MLLQLRDASEWKGQMGSDVPGPVSKLRRRGTWPNLGKRVLEQPSHACWSHAPRCFDASDRECQGGVGAPGAVLKD